MRQWKCFCIIMHIRKGKAGHSVGITRDSLTKQQKCNMEPDFVQFTGSTATRRALAACQNSKCKLECFRHRWLRCVCSSQLLLAPATGQEEVRSWQSCRSSWHWRRMIMTSDWLREHRHISPSPAIEQACKLLRENHALRGLRPLDAQELFTEPLSRAKEEEKCFSFSKRAINHA